MSVYELYMHVIETAISSLRDNYNAGLDDDALAELKSLWERKLAESGVVTVPMTPAQTYADAAMYKDLEGLIDASGPPVTQAGYVPQPSQSMLLSELLPMPTAQTFPVQSTTVATLPVSTIATPVTVSTTAISTTPLNVANGAKQPTKPAAKPPRRKNLDDEELNSDDDDLSDPEIAAATDNDASVPNIIIAFYEKVSRVKTKYKIQLLNGVMHLNGKDYLFHKANGEFNW